MKRIISCFDTSKHLTLKGISRQKKNYGNLNIFTMQEYNFQKNPLKERNQNPSRYHNFI
jgi:hypothetical protein